MKPINEPTLEGEIQDYVYASWRNDFLNLENVQ